MCIRDSMYPMDDNKGTRGDPYDWIDGPPGGLYEGENTKNYIGVNTSICRFFSFTTFNALV